MNAPQPTPMAHIDITPPSALIYAAPSETERCPSVAMLNRDASLGQLLGFAHGRCRELAMLATLAARGDSDESDLREAAEHLGNGLDTVLIVLDAMSRRLDGQP